MSNAYYSLKIFFISLFGISIFCIFSLWIIHDTHIDNSNFISWQNSILALDWSAVGIESSDVKFNIKAFRNMLRKAKYYNLSHDFSLQRGRIIISTNMKDRFVKFVVFEELPNTIIIYDDGFGYWSLGKMDLLLKKKSAIDN